MNHSVVLLLLVGGLSGSFQCAVADKLAQPACLSLAELSGSALQTTPGSEKASFMRAYTEAECFVGETARLGMQWLKTEQILHSSLQEADDGHWDEAFHLLKKARFQAEAALLQAEYESRAWKRRVISNPETGK